jgi:hypothetical protein
MVHVPLVGESESLGQPFEKVIGGLRLRLFDMFFDEIKIESIGIVYILIL